MANNHFAMLCTTEDAKEGVDAFLNKRVPEWKLKQKASCNSSYL